MINSISKIKNIGIYKDIEKNSCSNFARYNLVYGWNGSGKSTLSRILGCLEKKRVCSDFPSMQFSIATDEGVFSESNVQQFVGNIAVFNTDFIKDNIEWDGIIKSILYIDEDNIEAAKEYNKLKTELFGDEQKRGELYKLQCMRADVDKREKELDSALTKVAKVIKTNFQTIDMSDSRYLNYSRRTVKDILDKEGVSKEDLLSASDLTGTIAAAKVSEKMDTIDELAALKSFEQYASLFESVKRICKMSVTNQVIELLKDDSMLSAWVKTGLSIHKDRKLSRCAFCGAVLADERIVELDNHYNDAFNTLMQTIDDTIARVQNEYWLQENAIPEEAVFYEENRTALQDLKNEYCAQIKDINDELNRLVQYLLEKRNKPFEDINVGSLRFGFAEELENVNQTYIKIQQIIKANNNKTDSFENNRKIAQNKLERHYLWQELSTISYIKNEKEVKRLDRDASAFEKSLIEKRKKFEALEKSMSNETLASTEFNRTLAAFLGHNEIELTFDSEAKGYKVFRNNTELAKNLSEGEKTAIAFTYFITKLKENGKSIKDYILVIDDPISSFDSNKIFAAYAYMKTECEDAKQLFVLTHNYNFYSLILGWFNKRTKKIDGKKIPDFKLYRVENDYDCNGKRTAILRDGGESMKQATEYDYVFYNVLKLKNKKLSKGELIFCGNICRKLLESFLSFKYPKQRADFRALLDRALNKKEDSFKKERIYKFTNMYSHDKKINALEELDDDILFSNYETVIEDILMLIDELDHEHYSAMVDKVKNEISES